MHNEQDTTTIREKVLHAIQSGKAQMRPRWHFVFGGVLATLGMMIVLVLVLYFASLVVFSLQQSGAWFGTSFGSRGWLALLKALPLMLIAFTLFFIVILEILVRRYEFAYRRPLLYSLFVIIAGVLATACVAAPLHKKPLRAARENALPFFGPIYRGFGAQQRLGDVHRGVVTEAGNHGFVMSDDGGVTSTVVIFPGTRLPFGIDIEAGDTVVVVGREERGVIRAFGLQEVEE